MGKKSRGGDDWIWIKTIALFVLTCFSTTSIVWPAPPLPQSEVLIPSLTEKISLPSALGTVQKRLLGLPGAPVIIHVLDAHSSHEAQINTKKILTELTAAHGLDTIFLEGASSAIEPQFLIFSKDPVINKKIADQLSQEAVVGGTELFLLDKIRSHPKEKKIQAYGGEDPLLYEKNLKGFRKLFAKKDEAGEFLAYLKDKILTQVPFIFGPELKSFFREWLFYQDHPQELVGHLTNLQRYASKTNLFDITNVREQLSWPQLVRFFEIRKLEEKRNLPYFLKEKKVFFVWLKQHEVLPEDQHTFRNFLRDKKSEHRTPPEVTPRRFLENFYDRLNPRGFSFETYPQISIRLAIYVLQNELDIGALLEEFKRLTDQVLDRLAQTPEEKLLIAVYRDFLLLKRLFALEVTSEDYAEARRRTQDLRPSSLTVRLGLAEAKSPKIDFIFYEALQFYEGAREREKAMFEKVCAKMKEEKRSEAILVTGGFHAEGLEELFRQKGFSYVAISPHISKVDEESKYHDRLVLKENFLPSHSTLAAPRWAQNLDPLPAWDIHYLGARVLQTHLEVLADEDVLNEKALSQIALFPAYRGRFDLVPGNEGSRLLRYRGNAVRRRDGKIITVTKSGRIKAVSRSEARTWNLPPVGESGEGRVEQTIPADENDLPSLGEHTRRTMDEVKWTGLIGSQQVVPGSVHSQVSEIRDGREVIKVAHPPDSDALLKPGDHVIVKFFVILGLAAILVFGYFLFSRSSGDSLPVADSSEGALRYQRRVSAKRGAEKSLWFVLPFTLVVSLIKFGSSSDKRSSHPRAGFTLGSVLYGILLLFDALLIYGAFAPLPEMPKSSRAEARISKKRQVSYTSPKSPGPYSYAQRHVQEARSGVKRSKAPFVITFLVSGILGVIYVFLSYAHKNPAAAAPAMPLVARLLHFLAENLHIVIPSVGAGGSLIYMALKSAAESLEDNENGYSPKSESRIKIGVDRKWLEENRHRIVLISISGGESPGVNDYFAYAARELRKLGYIPMGVKNGIRGLTDEKLEEWVGVIDEETERELLGRGGSLFGTVRFDLMKPENQSKLEQAIRNMDGFAAFLTIGGGDHAILWTEIAAKIQSDPAWLSTDLAEAVNRILKKMIVVYKTIDGDTHGQPLGFYTAAGIARQLIYGVAASADAMGKIYVVRVMGADSGRLALSAASRFPPSLEYLEKDGRVENDSLAAQIKELGDRVITLIPESPVALSRVVDEVRRIKAEKGSATVVVAEGFEISEDDPLLLQMIDPSSAHYDSKAREAWEKYLEVPRDEHGNLKRAALEPEILVTRAIAHFLYPDKIEDVKKADNIAYALRGANPMHYDRVYARLLASQAARLIAQDKGGVVVSLPPDDLTIDRQFIYYFDLATQMSAREIEEKVFQDLQRQNLLRIQSFEEVYEIRKKQGLYNAANAYSQEELERQGALHGSAEARADDLERIRRRLESRLKRGGVEGGMSVSVSFFNPAGTIIRVVITGVTLYALGQTWPALRQNWPAIAGEMSLLEFALRGLRSIPFFRGRRPDLQATREEENDGGKAAGQAMLWLAKNGQKSKKKSSGRAEVREKLIGLVIDDQFLIWGAGAVVILALSLLIWTIFSRGSDFQKRPPGSPRPLTLQELHPPELEDPNEPTATDIWLPPRLPEQKQPSSSVFVKGVVIGFVIASLFILGALIVWARMANQPPQPKPRAETRQRVDNWRDFIEAVEGMRAKGRIEQIVWAGFSQPIVLEDETGLDPGASDFAERLAVYLKRTTFLEPPFEVVFSAIGNNAYLLSIRPFVERWRGRPPTLPYAEIRVVAIRERQPFPATERGNLQDAVGLIRRIILEAGLMIRKARRGKIVRVDKGGELPGDIITQTDLDVQEYLLDELEENLPFAFTVLAEEKEGELGGRIREINRRNQGADYEVIIDPIDGTKQFADPERLRFGTMLALKYKGENVAAFFLMPEAELETNFMPGYRTGTRQSNLGILYEASELEEDVSVRRVNWKDLPDRTEEGKFSEPVRTGQEFGQLDPLRKPLVVIQHPDRFDLDLLNTTDFDVDNEITSTSAILAFLATGGAGQPVAYVHPGIYGWDAPLVYFVEKVGGVVVTLIDGKAEHAVPTILQTENLDENGKAKGLLVVGSLAVVKKLLSTHKKESGKSRSEVRAVPQLGPTRPDLEETYREQVIAATPEHIKHNRLLEPGNTGQIPLSPGRLRVVLKREHLYAYDPETNPEGLNLWQWLEDYEKEARVATAGIRSTQNIVFPWSTYNRINEVGIALATLAKAMVAKETYLGAELIKLAGGEVRYNTRHYVELIARIQAAQGIRTLVTPDFQTIPIWMASFLIFVHDLSGGEHGTSSHANSSFMATKDLNNQGSQYLPEESARFVAKIRWMFEQAEQNGEFVFEIAPLDDPLIDQEFLRLIDEGVKLYADYLRNGVATEVNLQRIRGAKKKILIDNVGGSMHRIMPRIFRELGIEDAFEWLHTKEDSFYHGIGKDITADGKVLDYTQDTTIVKREPKTGKVTSIPVMERMGYDTLLIEKPVETDDLMVDPDGDRITIAQIEPAERAPFLEEVGVDYLRLDEERIVALYTPNQSFFMTMVYHANSLKEAGLWDNHPRFIIMTTASSAAWREWAEKNGVQVINVPVGFKEIAAMMKKIEAQMKAHPDKPVIVRDVFGREINLGVEPRLLFAGEESGGMIIGPEELIVSRGGREAIAMREKSAGEALVIQAAMAAYLESEGMYLSDYLKQLFDKDDIKNRFDVRHDKLFYNQNEPDAVKLRQDQKEGEKRRTENYVFYLSMAFALREGKITLEDVKRLLNDTFKGEGLNFDDLQEVHFVGDGVVLIFPTKFLEIRPSGTDAKSKSYAMGQDKMEAARFAIALGEYSGERTPLHRQLIDDSYFETAEITPGQPGMRIEKLAWDIYQEYYRDGLPPDEYVPPTDLDPDYRLSQPADADIVLGSAVGQSAAQGGVIAAAAQAATRMVAKRDEEVKKSNVSIQVKRGEIENEIRARIARLEEEVNRLVNEPLPAHLSPIQQYQHNEAVKLKIRELIETEGREIQALLASEVLSLTRQDYDALVKIAVGLFGNLSGERISSEEKRDFYDVKAAEILEYAAQTSALPIPVVNVARKFRLSDIEFDLMNLTLEDKQELWKIAIQYFLELKERGGKITLSVPAAGKASRMQRGVLSPVLVTAMHTHPEIYVNPALFTKEEREIIQSQFKGDWQAFVKSLDPQLVLSGGELVSKNPRDHDILNRVLHEAKWLLPASLDNPLIDYFLMNAKTINDQFEEMGLGRPFIAQLMLNEEYYPLFIRHLARTQAHGLKVRFVDKDGNHLEPTLENLDRIVDVDHEDEESELLLFNQPLSPRLVAPVKLVERAWQIDQEKEKQAKALEEHLAKGINSEGVPFQEKEIEKTREKIVAIRQSKIFQNERQFQYALEFAKRNEGQAIRTPAALSPGGHGWYHLARFLSGVGSRKEPALITAIRRRVEFDFVHNIDNMASANEDWLLILGHMLQNNLLITLEASRKPSTERGSGGGAFAWVQDESGKQISLVGSEGETRALLTQLEYAILGPSLGKDPATGNLISPLYQEKAEAEMDQGENKVPVNNASMTSRLPTLNESGHLIGDDPLSMLIGTAVFDEAIQQALARNYTPLENLTNILQKRMGTSLTEKPIKDPTVSSPGQDDVVLTIIPEIFAWDIQKAEEARQRMEVALVPSIVDAEERPDEVSMEEVRFDPLKDRKAYDNEVAQRSRDALMRRMLQGDLFSDEFRKVVRQIVYSGEKNEADRVDAILSAPLPTDVDQATREKYLKDGDGQPGFGVPAGAAIHGTKAVEGSQGYYTKEGEVKFLTDVNAMKSFFRNRSIKLLIKAGIGGQHTPFQGEADLVQLIDPERGIVLGEYELGKDYESSIQNILDENGWTWDQVAVVVSSKSGSTDETMMVGADLLLAMAKQAAQAEGIDGAQFAGTLEETLHEVNFVDGKERPAKDLFKVDGARFGTASLVALLAQKTGLVPELVKRILGRVLKNLIFETVPRPEKSRLAAFIKNSGLEEELPEENLPLFIEMYDNVGGRWTADLHVMVLLAFYGHDRPGRGLSAREYWLKRKEQLEKEKAGAHPGTGLADRILDEGIERIALVVPDGAYWFGQEIDQNFNESLWQEGAPVLVPILASQWENQAENYRGPPGKNRTLVINLSGIKIEGAGFNRVSSDNFPGLHSLHAELETANRLARDVNLAAGLSYLFGEIAYQTSFFYALTSRLGNRLIARALATQGYSAQDVDLRNLDHPATRVLQENLYTRQPFVELAKGFTERKLKALQEEEAKNPGAIKRAYEKTVEAARRQESQSNIPGLSQTGNLSDFDSLTDVLLKAREFAENQGRILVPILYIEGAEENGKYTDLGNFLTSLGIPWVLQGTRSQHIDMQKILSQPDRFLPVVISLVKEEPLPGRRAIGFVKGYADKVSPDHVRDVFAESTFEAFISDRVGGLGLFFRMEDKEEKLVELKAAFALASVEAKLSLSKAEKEEMIANLHREMEAGLAGKESSLAMLLSFVNPPTGNEKGKYLALDMGGSNFRVLEVELMGEGQIAEPVIERYSLPESVLKGSAKELFDFTAQSIADFRSKHPDDFGDDDFLIYPTARETREGLGFTFSFPVNQTGIAEGTLIQWVKEIAVTGVEGQDVVKLQNEALVRNESGLKVDALVNDSVGTLAAATYRDPRTTFALILGTGTNGTLWLELARIPKWKGEKPPGQRMAVNMEWGNFNKLRRTKYDERLDRDSLKPGVHVFEKMVSGIYLGELARLVLLDEFISKGILFAGEDTSAFRKKDSLKAEDLSEIAGDSSSDLSGVRAVLARLGIQNPSSTDLKIVKQIAVSLGERSAGLGATASAAVVKFVDPQLLREHGGAVDGSLYEKFPGYAAAFRKTLVEIFGDDASKIIMKLTPDGSGIGAAVITATVTRSKSRAEARTYATFFKVYPKGSKIIAIANPRPSGKLTRNHVTGKPFWAPTEEDIEYRPPERDIHGVLWPWSRYEDLVRARLAELKITHYEADGFSINNLYSNAWFVFYDGETGRLLHRYNEPFEERTYTLFVIWKDKSKGVSSEDLVFRQKSGADGEQGTEVSVYRDTDIEQKENLSDQIQAAFYGQRLIHKGENTPLDEIAIQTDDLYHFFRFPQVMFDDRQGRNRYGPHIGRTEMEEWRQKSDPRFRAVVQQDGYIVIDLGPYLVRLNIDDIKEKALSYHGYEEIGPGDPNKIRPEDLATGQYFIHDNKLHIKLRPFPYPHDLIGITKSGRIVALVFTGDKSKESGVTLQTIAVRARELYRQQYGDRVAEEDPIWELHLLANSKDAYRRHVENGEAVVAEASERPYDYVKGMVYIVQPRAEARSENRMGWAEKAGWGVLLTTTILSIELAMWRFGAPLWFHLLVYLVYIWPIKWGVSSIIKKDPGTKETLQRIREIEDKYRDTLGRAESRVSQGGARAERAKKIPFVYRLIQVIGFLGLAGGAIAAAYYNIHSPWLAVGLAGGAALVFVLTLFNVWLAKDGVLWTLYNIRKVVRMMGLIPLLRPIVSKTLPFILQFRPRLMKWTILLYLKYEGIRPLAGKEKEYEKVIQYTAETELASLPEEKDLSWEELLSPAVLIRQLLEDGLRAWAGYRRFLNKMRDRLNEWEKRGLIQPRSEARATPREIERLFNEVIDNPNDEDKRRALEDKLGRLAPTNAEDQLVSYLISLLKKNNPPYDEWVILNALEALLKISPGASKVDNQLIEQLLTHLQRLEKDGKADVAIRRKATAVRLKINRAIAPRAESRTFPYWLLFDFDDDEKENDITIDDDYLATLTPKDQLALLKFELRAREENMPVLENRLIELEKYINELEPERAGFVRGLIGLETELLIQLGDSTYHANYQRRTWWEFLTWSGRKARYETRYYKIEQVFYREKVKLPREINEIPLLEGKLSPKLDYINQAIALAYDYQELTYLSEQNQLASEYFQERIKKLEDEIARSGGAGNEDLARSEARSIKLKMVQRVSRAEARGSLRPPVMRLRKGRELGSFRFTRVRVVLIAAFWFSILSIGFYLLAKLLLGSSLIMAGLGMAGGEISHKEIPNFHLKFVGVLFLEGLVAMGITFLIRLAVKSVLNSTASKAWREGKTKLAVFLENQKDRLRAEARNAGESRPLLAKLLSRLAKREPLPAKVDLLIVFGSGDQKVPEEAARLYHEGKAPLILVSGRFLPNVPDDGSVRPEAHIYRDRLVELGVPASAILVEDQSRHMGQNAEFSFRLLQERNLIPKTAILIHSPLIQARGAQTARKFFTGTQIYDHAAYIPEVPSAEPGIKQFAESLMAEVDKINQFTPEIAGLEEINQLKDDLRGLLSRTEMRSEKGEENPELAAALRPLREMAQRAQQIADSLHVLIEEASRFYGIRDSALEHIKRLRSNFSAENKKAAEEFILKHEKDIQNPPKDPPEKTRAEVRDQPQDPEQDLKRAQPPPTRDTDRPVPVRQDGQNEEAPVKKEKRSEIRSGAFIPVTPGAIRAVAGFGGWVTPPIFAPWIAPVYVSDFVAIAQAKKRISLSDDAANLLERIRAHQQKATLITDVSALSWEAVEDMLATAVLIVRENPLHSVAFLSDRARSRRLNDHINFILKSIYASDPKTQNRIRRQILFVSAADPLASIQVGELARNSATAFIEWSQEARSIEETGLEGLRIQADRLLNGVPIGNFKYHRATLVQALLLLGNPETPEKFGLGRVGGFYRQQNEDRLDVLDSQLAEIQHARLLASAA